MMRRMTLLLWCALLALPALGQANLNGAGATFPYPIYSKWFSEYHKLHPDIQINYQPIGSGGGIRQVIAGTVDFGATDGPMTDDQLKEAKIKILHAPTVLGADVPAYNIPGVTGELKFTPQVLAGIFLGKITNWNDKAIAAANPGVSLPNQDIIVVHRSDGSGTTYIFTDYLAKVSPEWQNQVGKGTSVKWPTGIGGKGIIEHDISTGAHTFHSIPPLRQWVDLPPLSGAGLSPASLDEAIRATVDNFEGGIDDKIVRLVVRDVPRHILRELDHKALREYKRKALQFHLDTRRPDIVRPETGQAAPGRRASLADTVRDKLRSRVLTEDIDREALVELGLHYLREADLVAGPAEEEAIA